MNASDILETILIGQVAEGLGRNTLQELVYEDQGRMCGAL